MTRHEIAAVFEEIAVLLQLKGDNPFKIRAYQSGARALETLEGDLWQWLAEGRLGEVKGIGSALVEKIETLHRGEALPFYDELKASVAPGLLEILEIPGLGGKKVKTLHEELGVETVAGLEKACREGRVAALKGFGAKSAEKILSGIEHRAAYARRHLWWDASALAAPVLEGLRALPDVAAAEIAGSLRRLRETVGDLDFIAAAENSGPVMDWFTSREDVAEVTAKGATKSSVRLAGGLQADLRVVPPAQFAFALHHFTGSKEHNVALRQRALERGYHLSEWGLKPREEAPPETGDRERARGSIRSEAALFEFLGLAAIPPELREGAGEIEAAGKNELPELVCPDDLRGVFHNHTSASDGQATLEEMAAGAAERGWEYLGLADHSKASFQANGLDEARVARQVEAVRAFNASGKSPVHLFAGIECDILPDGRLDLSDDCLASLDYVVVSVHSSFGLDEQAMTTRVVRALEHPAATMLAHPTGRLLLRREPYRIDLEKVIDAAIANRVAIEINAHPRRLELDWRLWRHAAERGLLCSINPDAHSVEGLGYFLAGVNVARKGWLTKAQVLNCRSRQEAAEWLAERA